MHEWSLAESVVLTAAKVAKKENLSKVTEIRIKLGRLQQIEADIFKSALNEIIKSSRPLLKKAKIKLESEETVLRCRDCGKKWKVKNDLPKLDEEKTEAIHFVPEIAHAFIRCPKCKSPDFEITRGRGVWVDSIVGQKGK